MAFHPCYIILSHLIKILIFKSCKPSLKAFPAAFAFVCGAEFIKLFKLKILQDFCRKPPAA